ncbi:type II toxin-antitoxin system PemK/MazF family toxin [Tissierella sp. Yu-01]|uniref:type II toxin-antitoxin system PemK/MazF family toxin n=1 Tax=Tissierella sp. Yu-01 TaxID=3035694 RepID=UPI00240E2093|nr:type II toxin-antitoxin system PemK/MazF family toxin [Tissierella sp. Yu-01]WFA07847.1 type II toxin-antitoxin system PemK/MazF family toxin [Tissierella sp. Yu-01]
MAWNKEDNIRKSAIWLTRKIQLIDDKEKLLSKKCDGSPLRKIYRGGVYWVEFGTGNLGAEKNKTRPAVIISANHLNRSETVIVIPISTHFKYVIDSKGNKKPHKNHFILYKNKYNQLSEDSAIKCEDIRTIDVVRIRDLIFNIGKDDMKKVKLRLLYTLGY